MKILMVNYRYFVSGGPERYMFNVMEGLTKRGHQVIPFSIRYSRNQPTPYEGYFVKPLSREDEVTFKEQSLTPITLWRTFSRLFYAHEVEKAVRRIVKDTQPKVAYILHYLRKLSPSVLVGLKREGIPIAVRLSDYGLLCPQAHCLRDGTPCELCIQGNLWPSIYYRCVKQSFIISFANALATWFHRFCHYFNLIDVFIATNRFMYQMMLKAGFQENRLRYIPTLTDIDTFKPIPDFQKDYYIAYAGRLESIKGIHVLIDSLSLLRRRRPDLNLKAKMAGLGDKEYFGMLKQRVESSGLSDVVEFVGELNATELSLLLGRAYLTVIPVVIYENLPNAILESYACGTPVLASNLGSLRECIRDGETGFLFPAGDSSSLAKQIEYCLDHPNQVMEMGQKAREMAVRIYSPEKHLTLLEELFNELIEKCKIRREKRCLD